MPESDSFVHEALPFRDSFYLITWKDMENDMCILNKEKDKIQAYIICHCWTLFVLSLVITAVLRG